MPLHHILVFIPTYIATVFMQKHITAVDSKLLWHQKWYIIHIWHHYMTS